MCYYVIFKLKVMDSRRLPEAHVPYCVMGRLYKGTREGGGEGGNSPFNNN